MSADFDANQGHSSSGERLEGTVKWYNADKGFGFAEFPGNGDAFLHASVLERSGLKGIAQGAQILCEVVHGPKGASISVIHEIRPAEGITGEMTGGRVKFFNTEKGFGFIELDNGGPDVFVHIRTLERAGISTLEKEQRVRLISSQGQRGPVADTVELE